MSTSDPDYPLISDVGFEDDSLVVRLDDGRELRVPLSHYPRLRNATDAERADYRLVGGGVGIHWERLDEDLSVRGMLAPHLAAVPR